MPIDFVYTLKLDNSTLKLDEVANHDTYVVHTHVKMYIKTST